MSKKELITKSPSVLKRYFLPQMRIVVCKEREGKISMSNVPKDCCLKILLIVLNHKYNEKVYYLDVLVLFYVVRLISSN